MPYDLSHGIDNYNCSPLGAD